MTQLCWSGHRILQHRQHGLCINRFRTPKHNWCTMVPLAWQIADHKNSSMSSHIKKFWILFFLVCLWETSHWHECFLTAMWLAIQCVSFPPHHTWLSSSTATLPCWGALCASVLCLLSTCCSPLSGAFGDCTVCTGGYWYQTHSCCLLYF
jgi:hypothetical protein